jgi:hypothetical protein
MTQVREGSFERLGSTGQVFIRDTVIRDGGAWTNPLALTANPAYIGLTEQTDISIYVMTTGNDTTGDGSSTLPYATIDRALRDIITAQLPTGSRVRIYLGAGSFDIPSVSHLVPANISCLVIGDLSSPIFSGTADPSALVDGYKSVYDVDIGAYGASVTEASHWIYNNWTVDYPGYKDFAIPVMPSTSPNIRYSCYDVAAYGSFSVNPYNTTLVFPEAQDTFLGNDASPPGEFAEPSIGVSGFGVIGVKLDGGSSSRFLNVRKLNMQAVKFQDANDMFFVVSDCLASIASTENSYITFSRCILFGSVINTSNYIKVKTLDMWNCYMSGTGGITCEGDYINLNYCDFRCPGAYALYCYSPTYVYVLSCSVYASFFFNGELNSVLYMDGPAQYQTTGVCTGPGFIVRLSTGSQARGLEASCAITNSGTAGNQIVVGANAAATFASLPANDIAAGATCQFCRAS